MDSQTQIKYNHNNANNKFELQPIISLNNPNFFIFQQLLDSSLKPLTKQQLQVVLNQVKLIQNKVYAFYNSMTKHQLLNNYYQLINISQIQHQRISTLINSAIQDTIIPHDFSKKLQLQEKKNQQSIQSGVKILQQTSRSLSYEQIIKKAHKTKKVLEQKKLKQIERKKKQQDQQNEVIQETLKELKWSRKQRLKQKLTLQKSIRSEKQIQRKEQQKRFKQFLKQFKNTKSLHEIKQEEFKMRQQQQNNKKTQEINKKLKEKYKKPMNFQQIRKHQQQYFNYKNKFFHQRNTVQYQQSKQSIKKYWQGKHHMIIRKQIQDKKKSKDFHGNVTRRIKDYEINILKKMQIRTKKNNNMITFTPKQSSINLQDSLNKQTVLKKNKMISLGNEYLQYSKSKRSFKAKIISEQSQAQILQLKPKRKSYRKKVYTQMPNIQKMKYRDRFEVQNLIFKNHQRDESIRREEQFKKASNRQGKLKKKMLYFDDGIQERYVKSIKEKLKILESLDS